MGLALVTVGILMVVTGGRGTYAQFGTLLANEFQGPNNFVYWLIALGSVGAIGYVQELKTISRLLMTLVIIVLFLKQQGGFFSQFKTALAQGPTAPNAPNAATSAAATPTASTVYTGMNPATGQPTTTTVPTGTFGESPAPSISNLWGLITPAY
jgi:hypothetical protein